MIYTIHKIQEWFKQYIGIPVPIGDYVVPIDGKKFNITIGENQKIYIKDKVTYE